MCKIQTKTKADTQCTSKNAKATPHELILVEKKKTVNLILLIQ